LLVPERVDNRVLGSTRLTDPPIFAGHNLAFDEGVGLDNGQILNPVALAFDRSRSRLLVLDMQGRLQVLDGRPEQPGDVSTRYITKWGTFGSGKGEFLVSRVTSVAVVVDSEGTICVADGSARVQVFEP